MISKITKVTVFQQGAEITRTLKVNVHSGKNKIIFTNLPAEIVLSSLTTQINGDAQLMSVTSRNSDSPEAEMSAAITKLQEELADCEENLAQLLATKDILEDECEFLKANRQVGSDQGLKLDDLQQMEAYYRQRLQEISSERLSLQKKQKELETQREYLLSQLGRYTQTAQASAIEVTVEVSAEKETEIDVLLSYFLHAAGWTPLYELRVKDNEHPALLISKAEVYQNTGEDWQEVSMILSSSRPSLQGAPPELQPWYLDIEQPTARISACQLDCCEEILDEEYSFRNYEARQNGNSLEFVLPTAVSLPALGDGERLELARYELNATYQHFCIPKIDTDVFLLAKIAGWEALDLLEGPATIYVGNTYVGEMMIDPRRADEVLNVSLGKDRGVIVSRIKGKDFTSSTLMGANHKVKRAWQIKIKNTRQTRIKITILDQLPVAVSKAITVEAVELSGAEYNQETGELCWECQIEPREAVELAVKYTVTYPKKELINLE